ncbi:MULTISPECIES: hypothetical protein [unclassified Streptomyces]|uniref:hypothetical protein n=1 Tax=unclassified Streptomyces TaxID=2593676 RepID=UPI0011B05F8C|nr:hypothetical protein [Streptomyces sp. SM10]
MSGTLQWNIPMWSGGDDSHTGFGGTGFRTVLTRADGTQVAAVNSRAGRASNLPAGSYTLTATGQRSNTTWPTSTRTSTAWGFDFTRPAARADVPLLNVGYSLDTDLQGLARAGKTLDLGVSAATVPGDVKANAATLQVSYDEGTTWQNANLHRRGDGRWTADLRTPRTAHSVSLRVTAQAPGGFTIEQEVISAIGLR